METGFETLRQSICQAARAHPVKSSEIKRPSPQEFPKEALEGKPSQRMSKMQGGMVNQENGKCVKDLDKR